MADFQIAFTRTMKFEDYNLSGVVTPEPNGGIARFGINSIAHPEVYPEMQTCSRERALEIAEQVMRTAYWRFDGVEDQDVANKLFDMAVNMGLGQAVRLLQRIVQETADGTIGPLTLTATNDYNASMLVDALRTASIDFYQSLANKNPAKYGSSLPGWLKRASR